MTGMISAATQPSNPKPASRRFTQGKEIPGSYTSDEDHKTRSSALPSRLSTLRLIQWLTAQKIHRLSLPEYDPAASIYQHSEREVPNFVHSTPEALFDLRSPLRLCLFPGLFFLGIRNLLCMAHRPDQSPFWSCLCIYLKSGSSSSSGDLCMELILLEPSTSVSSCRSTP